MISICIFLSNNLVELRGLSKGGLLGFEVYLGNKKQFLAVNAALFDTIAHGLFAAIGFRRVDHAIAAFNRRCDCVFADFAAKHKCAEPGKRHLNTIIQSQIFHICPPTSYLHRYDRYAILKQREEAYKRVEEAKATAKYMDDKAAHYAAILAGLAPDDTSPKNWTAANRPKHKAEKL